MGILLSLLYAWPSWEGKKVVKRFSPCCFTCQTYVSFARCLSQYCFICQVPVISRAQYMLFNLSNTSSHVVSRMVKNALRQNSRIFIITRIEVYPVQPFLFVWNQAVILIGKRGDTWHRRHAILAQILYSWSWGVGTSGIVMQRISAPFNKQSVNQSLLLYRNDQQNRIRHFRFNAQTVTNVRLCDSWIIFDWLQLLYFHKFLGSLNLSVRSYGNSLQMKLCLTRVPQNSQK